MMDTCVCCGEVIPEGRMICWACENRQGEMITYRKEVNHGKE